jgi:DNA-binding NarL/FixJ family response regulator
MTYLAVPLIGADGKRMGYLGLLDNRSWTAGEEAEAEGLLRLIVPRAGAELERHRLAIDRATRSLEVLACLPDQVARIRGDGAIVDVIMPSEKSNMVALFPSASFRRNLPELLPPEEVERLTRAIRDAVRGNAVAACTVHVPYDGEEREYELRVVPMTVEETLVFVRDRTAEQWVPQAYAMEAARGRPSRVVRENPYGLTFREVGVLELMSQGASDKEIASKLGVSVFTVYKHVSKILHKMNAGSRTEASLRTVREGLFD